MYTLDKIENQFKGICAKAGVSCNVPITINSRLTRTLGRVVINNSIGATDTWKPIKVEFSKQFIETSSDASIEDVIKHEAAHFIATSRTGKIADIIVISKKFVRRLALLTMALQQK